MTTGETILETRGLTKEFKGFVAVDNVSIRVRRGAIHALIGPNGAGKTTFFNLLTKFLPPTAGSILFKGDDITRERPADIAPRHDPLVSRFPPCSRTSRASRTCASRCSEPWARAPLWKRERTLAVLDQRAMALLDRVGLRVRAGPPGRALAYGRRTLEIATTLAMDPELMPWTSPPQAWPRGRGPAWISSRKWPQAHRAHGRAQHERGLRHLRHDHGPGSAAQRWRRKLRGGSANPGGDGGAWGTAHA
jgi:branched-chain amino acid transport system ATP-binding protein